MHDGGASHAEPANMIVSLISNNANATRFEQKRRIARYRIFKKITESKGSSAALVISVTWSEVETEAVQKGAEPKVRLMAGYV